MTMTAQYKNLARTPENLWSLGLFHMVGRGATVLELWHHLPSGSRMSLLELQECLTDARERGIIDCHRGSYFFTHDTKVELSSVSREKIVITKWSIVRQWRWIFSWLPFVRGVFVVGSVANESSTPESDIDLLIIVRRHTIWWTRLFITLLFDLLRVRRKGTRIKNKLCLSHFIDEDHLELSEQTIYDALNKKNCIPVYVRDDDLYSRFYTANQKWFLTHFSSGDPLQFHPAISVVDRSARGMALEIITSPALWPAIYTAIRRRQIKVIQANPLTALPESRILYSDGELVFHPEPKDKLALEKFAGLISSLYN